VSEAESDYLEATMNLTYDTLRDEIHYACVRVDVMLGASTVDDKVVLARYAAAFPGNFTNWMGAALVSARSDVARDTLAEKLGYEFHEDHYSMLVAFAAASGASPVCRDRTHVEPYTREIRGTFTDAQSAGLSGVMLCAFLETVSAVFIPDLAERAGRCGCKDFTYTECHGVANAEHADALMDALRAECKLGYPDAVGAHQALRAAEKLIGAIYA
jgi:hypothetical protein